MMVHKQPVQGSALFNQPSNAECYQNILMVFTPVLGDWLTGGVL